VVGIITHLEERPGRTLVRVDLGWAAIEVRAVDLVYMLGWASSGGKPVSRM
jgi:hypothetical protein